MIFDETERQRLCAIVAHCQLVRLYLIVEEYSSAQSSLTCAFSLSKESGENSELLKYAHNILKTTWEYSNREVSRAYKIKNATAGSIAESHLRILHELLQENSSDPGLFFSFPLLFSIYRYILTVLIQMHAEILQWLGHRYTEKSDFDTARAYYKRYSRMNH